MDVFRYEIDLDGVISCFFDLKKAKDTDSQIPLEKRNAMAQRGVIFGEEHYQISEMIPYEEGYFILPHTDLLVVSRVDKCTIITKEDEKNIYTQRRIQNNIDEEGYYSHFFYSFATQYDYDVPGCIVFFCEKHKELKDNELLFKVYPKTLENGNYPSNDVYTQFLTYSYSYYCYGISSIHTNCHELYPTEWLYKTGDYVKTDNVVCRVVNREGVVVFEYKALKDGFIEIVNGYRILFRVYSNETLYLEEKGYFSFEPLVTTDSFTNEVTVTWDKISLYKNGFWMYAEKNAIQLSFQYREGNGYLVIHFRKPNSYSPFNLKVYKGDLFSFLFEDGTIIDYKIPESPYKLDSDKDVKEVKISLCQEDIDTFQHVRLKHWKFSQTKMAKESVVGGLWNKEEDAKYMPQAFQQYAQAFVDVLHTAVPQYSFPKKEEVKAKRASDNNQVNIMLEPCYVYLMKDIANGYSKIGISNKPSYREHTLQSEKPTIELVCAKQFPSRKIALAIESAMHATYDAKHIRGELFNLDEIDIEEIKQTLK